MQHSGFDTHSDAGGILDEKMEEFNACVGAFVAEMKRTGTWEQVTVVTLSDFGRTLTWNGRGTDHAWAGHQMALGGALKSGQASASAPGEFGSGTFAKPSRNLP